MNRPTISLLCNQSNQPMTEMHLSTTRHTTKKPSTGKINCSHTAHATKTPTDWRNQPAYQAHTQPKQPATGEKHPSIHHPRNQNSQAMAENTRHRTTHATKTPTDWRNQPAYQAHTHPKQPATGEIHPHIANSHDQNSQSVEKNILSITIHAPKLSSHWRKSPINHHPRSQKPKRWQKTPAHQSFPQPKHPTAGEKHPLANHPHTQNSQPVEKSVRPPSPDTTKTPKQWRETPTATAPTRPKHPAGGRNWAVSHRENH